MAKYNYTPTTDDLMHYGVLGMKWGRRKAKASSGGGTKKTRASKSNTEERSKFSESNKRLYSKVNEYEAKQSKGKEFAKNLILGPAGRTTYNMARATNHSRASSFARSFFDINVGSLIGTTFGTAAGVVANKSNLGIPVQAVSTGVSIGTQWGIDNAYRNSGRAASLQQRAMMKKYYQSRRR